MADDNALIRVAVLWLVTDDGDVLLAQRAHNKETDPSVWGPSVTGRLEPGEDFNTALTREVEEELALKPAAYKPRLLHERIFAHPDGRSRRFVTYVATVPRTIIDQIHFDTNEVAAVRWMPVQELVTVMRDNPSELVPSANAVWYATFRAIWPDLPDVLADEQ